MTNLLCKLPYLSLGTSLRHLFLINYAVQDPASSINAAVAVACMVGHEENKSKLQLDEDLVSKMLEVLEAACQVTKQRLAPHVNLIYLNVHFMRRLTGGLLCASQGVMAYGMFWTVWKLCQGLTNLTVNDNNKVRMI